MTGARLPKMKGGLPTDHGSSRKKKGGLCWKGERGLPKQTKTVTGTVGHYRERRVLLVNKNTNTKGETLKSGWKFKQVWVSIGGGTGSGYNERKGRGSTDSLAAIKNRNVRILGQRGKEVIPYNYLKIGEKLALLAGAKKDKKGGSAWRIIQEKKVLPAGSIKT